MSSKNYEKVKFNIALYDDKEFKVQDMLSGELQDVLFSHYSDLESLLEDIYDRNIHLILLSIEEYDDDLEYALTIINDQAKVEEIPVIVVANETLLEGTLMQKYTEIDFIRAPLNYMKVKHRIGIYCRFFEKNFELTRARKIADDELKTVQAIFNVHESMLILFKENEVTMVNQQFLEFTNFENFNDFYIKSARKFALKDSELYCASHDGNNEWVNELLAIEESKRIVIMKNGEGIKRSFKVNIKKFNLECEYTLVSFDDITNLYNQAKMYEEYAHYDTLTGLANRRKFDEEVQKHIKSHIRHSYKLSMIMIDIDHFKKINDTFGHNEGDNILKLLASLLQEHVREEDLVSRWGGEEFIVLLPYTNLEGAALVAEHLRAKIHYIMLQDTKELSCSFGVAEYNDSLSVEEWISNADEALYAAKASGRDCVKVYDKE